MPYERWESDDEKEQEQGDRCALVFAPFAQQGQADEVDDKVALSAWPLDERLHAQTEEEDLFSEYGYLSGEAALGFTADKDTPDLHASISIDSGSSHSATKSTDTDMQMHVSSSLSASSLASAQVPAQTQAASEVQIPALSHQGAMASAPADPVKAIIDLAKEGRTATSDIQIESIKEQILARIDDLPPKPYKNFKELKTLFEFLATSEKTRSKKKDSHVKNKVSHVRAYINIILAELHIRLPSEHLLQNYYKKYFQTDEPIMPEDRKQFTIELVAFMVVNANLQFIKRLKKIEKSSQNKIREMISAFIEEHNLPGVGSASRSKRGKRKREDESLTEQDESMAGKSSAAPSPVMLKVGGASQSKKGKRKKEDESLTGQDESKADKSSVAPSPIMLQDDETILKTAIEYLLWQTANKSKQDDASVWGKRAARLSATGEDMDLQSEPATSGGSASSQELSSTSVLLSSSSAIAPPLPPLSSLSNGTSFTPSSIHQTSADSGTGSKLSDDFTETKKFPDNTLRELSFIEKKNEEGVVELFVAGLDCLQWTSNLRHVSDAMQHAFYWYDEQSTLDPSEPLFSLKTEHIMPQFKFPNKRTSRLYALSVEMVFIFLAYRLANYSIIREVDFMENFLEISNPEATDTLRKYFPPKWKSELFLQPTVSKVVDEEKHTKQARHKRSSKYAIEQMLQKKTTKASRKKGTSVLGKRKKRSFAMTEDMGLQSEPAARGGSSGELSSMSIPLPTIVPGNSLDPRLFGSSRISRGNQVLPTAIAGSATPKLN